MAIRFMFSRISASSSLHPASRAASMKRLAWARSFDAFLQRNGFVPIARDFEYEYQYNVLYVKQQVLDLPRFDYVMTDYFSKIGAAR